MIDQLVGQVQGFLVDVFRQCVWLAFLILIFVPLERFFALRRRTLTREVLAADLAYYFLNGLIPAFILALPLSLVASLARQLTPDAYTEALAELPFWVRLAASLLIVDIGSYWAHRLAHEHPLLWRFHVVHHAPEHLDWLVNSRAHPVDLSFIRLGGLAPLYVLGLATPTTGNDAMIPVYITVIGAIWAFFIHANVRWRLGPLEWLVSTPAFHHWHHTNDEHRDHNYAAMFPFVDRMFGTHYLPPVWPAAYGVDAPQPASMSQQLLQPFLVGHRRRSPIILDASSAPGSGDGSGRLDPLDGR